MNRTVVVHPAVPPSLKPILRAYEGDRLAMEVELELDAAIQLARDLLDHAGHGLAAARRAS